MEEHRVVVGGRALWVVEAGDRAGTPVIMYHGTPGAPLFWDEWRDRAAARGVRLVCYARPGYTGSSPAPGRTVADGAADCAAVADALGIDRFATWGVSGGGPHALAAAALLPGRVFAVATVGGLAPWDAEDLDVLDGMLEDNAAEVQAARAGDAALRELLEPTRAAMAAGDRGALLGQLDAFLDDRDLEVARAGFGEVLVDGIRLGLRDGLDGWIQDDLAFAGPWGFDPSEIACPAGVWHGGQDSMVPVAHAHWLAAHLKDAHVVVPGDAGHLAMVAYRMDEVHEWLLRFR
ncbi:alpha/beta fold hydrolase [Actinomadura terrae]|uniref:alpha/beta fold hydrolase n=1 Tax=Actinomadura terrae TaxID=604353 RepID=UPI001FA7A52D|nr:alpha/beta hydrolase [Actinomadura terrae]